jgi:hypothetical protein
VSRTGLDDRRTSLTALDRMPEPKGEKRALVEGARPCKEPNYFLFSDKPPVITPSWDSECNGDYQQPSVAIHA